MSEKCGKKYVLSPPDGGWGYLICIAAILQFAAMTGFMACFGMLYNDFMNEVNMTTAGATLVGGVQGFFVAISGFFTSPLLKIMSQRQLVLLGDTCYIINSLGMVFATTKIEFILYLGVFTGVGYGIIFNVLFTALNEYFVKRRMLAFSILQTLTALFAMITPTITKVCLSEFGFRGTQLIITGISLQTYIGALLLQPVGKHMRKVQVEDGQENKYLLLNESEEKENAVKEENGAEEKLSLNLKDNTDVYVAGDAKLIKSFSLIQWLDKVLDFTAVKPFLKSSVLWASVISSFCELNFMFMVPQSFYAAHWDEENVARALSFLAFGDLATRVLSIVLNKWIKKISSLYIYFFGVFLAIVTRLAMIWFDNKIIIYIALTIMGFPHCILLTFLPLVIAEVVEPEQFSAAMGFSMMFFGFACIVLGPVVGAIRDLTGSYSVAFYTYVLLLVIGFVPWLSNFLLDLYRKRLFTLKNKFKPNK